MEVVFTLLFATLFSYVVYNNKFFQAEGITKKSSVALFNLKVLAGLVLALIYTFYYTDKASADIYKYFLDGEIIYNLLSTDPLAYFQIIFGINTDSTNIQEVLDTTKYWYKPYSSPFYNDNRTIIRFNALAHVVSFGSIGVHTVIMAFLSFTGLLAMYKFARQRLAGKEKELILAIFLLPSVIFWGSGVLKEGLLLFSLGISLYLWDKLLRDKFKLKRFLFFILGILLLCISKIYILMALLIPMIAYTWVSLTGGKQVLIKYLATACTFVFLGLNLNWFVPELDLVAILIEKQKDFVNLAIASNAQSYYNIPILEENLLGFLKAGPLAFLNVLTRPHIFEAENPMMMAAALENLLILLVIVLCIIFSKKGTGERNFLFFCISFVVVLFILVGMITPILGAVVRYKIPGLPFLLIISLLFFDKDQFMAKFPSYKFMKT